MQERASRYMASRPMRSIACASSAPNIALVDAVSLTWLLLVRLVTVVLELLSSRGSLACPAPRAVTAVISFRSSTRCRRPLTPSTPGTSCRACTSRPLPTRWGRTPCFGSLSCTPASRSPSSARRGPGCPRARRRCAHGETRAKATSLDCLWNRHASLGLCRRLRAWINERMEVRR